MDRLTSLRVFRDVVEAGSFASAARRLAISPPMVSKHLASLEHALGARLLHRTSRRLSLTEAGSLYYEQCCEALDLLQAADSAIGRHAQAPHGQLKVSAPVWCATAGFARVLAGYRERFPEVVVDLHLENRRVDLVSEGFDLALRATGDPSPTLIVRPLCELRFFLVATPELLRRHGEPREPADAASIPAVLPNYVNIEAIDLAGPAGRMRLRFSAAMKSDDTTLSYHAVHAGIGMALLPHWLVSEDLAQGRLRQVLPDHATLPITLYAAYVSRKHMTAKLRSFIDFIGPALRDMQA